MPKRKRTGEAEPVPDWRDVRVEHYRSLVHELTRRRLRQVIGPRGTASQVAKDIGTSKATTTNVPKGKAPSGFELWVKLAIYLGMTPLQFLAEAWGEAVPGESRDPLIDAAGERMGAARIDIDAAQITRRLRPPATTEAAAEWLIHAERQARQMVEIAAGIPVTDVTTVDPAPTGDVVRDTLMLQPPSDTLPPPTNGTHDTAPAAESKRPKPARRTRGRRPRS